MTLSWRICSRPVWRRRSVVARSAPWPTTARHTVPTGTSSCSVRSGHAGQRQPDVGAEHAAAPSAISSAASSLITTGPASRRAGRT